MHFRWDSGVARDISSELDWLTEELDDCNAGIERCATILREMAGNDSDGLIENYISLIGELKKGMAKLEESFSATSRGINRANELIDGNEQVLRRQAEKMTAGSSTRTPRSTRLDLVPIPSSLHTFSIHLEPERPTDTIHCVQSS